MIINERIEKTGNVATIYSAPEFYHNGKEWADIDTNLEPGAKWETNKQSVKNNFKAYFNDKTDLINPCLASFEYQGKWINYKLVDAKPQKTIALKDEITYQEVYPNTDLIYKVTSQGLKETILVKSSARAFYEFTVKTNAEIKDFNLIAFATDSNGKYGKVAIEYGKAFYKGIEYDSIRLIPDVEFLKTAVYPIEIDPTTTIQPATKDTYVDQANPTVAHGTDTVLYAKGTAAQLKYGLLYFDTSAIAGEKTSAKLNLYITNSGNTASITVHDISQSWLDTATWNTKPTFNATPLDTESVPTSAGWKEFDVINSDFLYGWLIKNNTTATEISFPSSNYTLNTTVRPKLTIIYINAAPTITAPASTTVGTPTSYSDELTPNITASLGAYTITKFRVYLYSGANLYFDSGEVTGAAIDYNVPVSAELEYNTTYGVKVSGLGSDGNWTEISTMHYLTCAMSAISDLSTSDVTAGIKLDWTASTAEGITGYNIYRSLTTATGFTLLETTTSNTYTDYQVESGVTYYYHIKVKEGKNESPASNEVNNSVSYSGWYINGTVLLVKYDSYSRQRRNHSTSREIIGQTKNTVQSEGLGGNILTLIAITNSDAVVNSIEALLASTVTLHHASLGQWKVNLTNDPQISDNGFIKEMLLIFEEVE